MKSVIDFLINPVFSEPVMEFYMTTFGEKLGIILLGFVKMFLVFAGGFIITFPVISLIAITIRIIADTNHIKKLVADYIEEKQEKGNPNVINIEKYRRKKRSVV